MRSKQTLRRAKGLTLGIQSWPQVQNPSRDKCQQLSKHLNTPLSIPHLKKNPSLIMSMRRSLTHLLQGLTRQLLRSWRRKTSHWRHRLWSQLGITRPSWRTLTNGQSRVHLLAQDDSEGLNPKKEATSQMCSLRLSHTSRQGDPPLRGPLGISQELLLIWTRAGRIKILRMLDSQRDHSQPIS